METQRRPGTWPFRYFTLVQRLLLGVLLLSASLASAAPPAGAWKVVGVTEAQISTTNGDIAGWGIAGLGSIGGQSCVVSSFIYKKHSKSKKVMLRRLGDLAVHELGHTLGFPHCEVKACVMADAKGKAIKSADESSGQYCAQCLELLAPEDRALHKQQQP